MKPLKGLPKARSRSVSVTLAAGWSGWLVSRWQNVARVGAAPKAAACEFICRLGRSDGGGRSYTGLTGLSGLWRRGMMRPWNVRALNLLHLHRLGQKEKAA